MIEILARSRAFLPMNSELEELYQAVILDHSRRPRNFGEIAGAAVRVHGDNPSCGDEIHLDVKFGAEERGRHQVHRSGLRDQPGLGFADDDEAERASRARTRRRCCAPFTIWSRAEATMPAATRRSAVAAGRPQISSAGKVRDAGLARAGTSAPTKCGRIHHFHGKRFR